MNSLLGWLLEAEEKKISIWRNARITMANSGRRNPKHMKVVFLMGSLRIHYVRLENQQNNYAPQKGTEDTPLTKVEENTL